MNKTKRIATLILALVMVFTLVSACGKGGTTPSADATKTPGDLSQAENVYVPQFIKIEGSEGISRTNNGAAYFDGRIYFAARVVTGTEKRQYETGEKDSAGNPVMAEYEVETATTKLMSVKDDGTDLKALEAYEPARTEVPEGWKQDNYIDYMTSDKDGNIYILERVSTYMEQTEAGASELEANPAPVEEVSMQTEGFFLRKIDLTGAETGSADIAEIREGSEYFYAADMVVSADGNVLLADGDGNMYMFDKDLGLKGKTRLEGENNHINKLLVLADGSVAVTYYYNGGTAITKIDFEKAAVGETIKTTLSAWEFYPGNGDYDFFYTSGTLLMGYKVAEKASEAVLSWINSDVDTNNLFFALPLADGRIICCQSTESNTKITYSQGLSGGGVAMTTEENSKAGIELIVLTKTPRTELPEKKILTYATASLNYNLKAEILNFNRTSGEYRIEVRDYSEFNTPNDWNAGRTKLMTELTAGRIPDILDTQSVPIESLAKKGMLEDLMPMLDADTKIGGSSGLVQPVLSVMKDSEGKLYAMYSGYQIISALGASEIVGEEAGLTVEEAKAALAKLPEGAQFFETGLTKANYLQMLCYLGIDGFVNWETGECSFDSPEFIEMLEFANLFPDAFDWEKYDYSNEDEGLVRIIEKKQLLMAANISGDFSEFRKAYSALGGKLTFTGLPGASGNGSAISFDTGLAITTACKDKAGAWSFISRFLAPEYQRVGFGYLPVNQKVFDELIKEQMTPTYADDPNAEGGKVEVPKVTTYLGWKNPVEIKLYAMTQAELDIIMGLINNTKASYMFDEKLTAIVTEEAAAFFTGTKSAEETAKMIQNRVSIYVSEQS